MVSFMQAKMHTKQYQTLIGSFCMLLIVPRAIFHELILIVT